ncbi:MAG: hypothetical protein AAGG48_03990 [Planctomycetota bacterium]
MRIPSQFNEDSLYRSGRRSAQSAQSHRRLLRLVLGLALVLVLMRQAARPEIYRVFFGAPAAQTTYVAIDQSTRWANVDNQSLDSGTTRATPVVIDAADREIANELVAALVPSDQHLWVIALTRWQRNVRIPEYPSTAESLYERLDALESTNPTRVDDWRQMLTALELAANEAAASTEENEPSAAFIEPSESSEGVENQTQPTDQNQAGPSAQQRVLTTAFLASLDDAANARVVDGSVWRSGDFDAFYRYLDQASEFMPQGLASTGVLPLLQQPDVFLGQMVRVQGTVARAERMPAKENSYGIEAYWQLWLRPSDGVERPLVVIVPEVSDSIANVNEQAPEELGPPVIVAGRFLKRLAYTSSMGADLAPVVIGQLALAVPQTAPVEEAATETDGNLSLSITVLLASLIGVGLAVIAMWRTTTAASDARRLRTAYRAGPDFAGLDEVTKESSFDAVMTSPSDPPSS